MKAELIEHRLLVLVLCATVTACDPQRSSAIALAPGPVVQADSVAFAMAAAIAARHGLTPRQVSKPLTGCSQDGRLILCWKSTRGEPQFRIQEATPFPLGAKARRIQRELMDSLRTRFGADAVRVCVWSGPWNTPDEGCPPAPQSEER